MIDTIAKYVKNCHHCKRTKHYREDKQELLKLLFISKRYFIDISIDFITSLSICERNDRRYQHIMMIMNRLSKKKRFMTLNSLKIQTIIQAFVEWIWKKEDYFLSIISNRNFQFISHFWKRLCKRIKTHSKLSTTWYSKTNDQIEIANADLKTYLRAYVNFNQNDWMNQLFIVEFEINSIKNSSTDIESFLTTKSYLLKSKLKFFESMKKIFAQRKEMKNANKLIKKLKKIRVYLREKFKWVQALMKEQTNQKRHSTSKLRIKNKIMLNAKHFKTLRLNKDLNYKNLRSFTVNKIINKFVCRLKLFASMQEIFSMFHSWFLHLNDFDFMSDQIDEKSDSITIDERENEYSVNEIFNSKINEKKMTRQQNKENVFNIKSNELNTKSWIRNSNDMIILK